MYYKCSVCTIEAFGWGKNQINFKIWNYSVLFCLMLAHCEWSHLMTKMFLSAIVTKKPSKRDVPFIREMGEMEQSAFLGLEEGL